MDMDIKRIAREILSYFIRNPKAADTLEGIARWRLLNDTVHRKVQESRVSLNWLVYRGFLLETSSPSLGNIFSLNPAKITQAERFLAMEGKRRSPRRQ
jgi:hypothetical protein